jgi:flagellar hook-associated protein 3 FlgL
MRVTQSLDQTQFLTSLDTLESNISQTQNQISTGLQFTTPSGNPVAAGNVNSYNQVLAQSQQYASNGNAAQSSLNTEDSTLTQVQTQLQSLRSLALEANSGTSTGVDLSAIAAQATQIQSSLLALANTQDGQGQYIFGGFATQAQPFSPTSAGASYQGDQGQQLVQIAAGQTIAAGDNGDAVFNQIKTGNGTFAVAAAAGNIGSGIIGATTVSGSPAYAGHTYQINFSSPTAYTITDTNTAVPPVSTTSASQTYTSGQPISYGGVQVTLTGTPGVVPATVGPPPTPAVGDSFTVTPSSNQSLFTTVQNLVNAIQSGASGSNSAPLNNAIAAGINNLDQAANQISTVQANVGGRLNAITTQLSVQSSQQLQLQKSITSLQGLDYASAYTSLESQNTTLSASMQAYTLTQGLTLFKYIS